MILHLTSNFEEVSGMSCTLQYTRLRGTWGFQRATPVQLPLNRAQPTLTKLNFYAPNNHIHRKFGGVSIQNAKFMYF